MKNRYGQENETEVRKGLCSAGMILLAIYVLSFAVRLVCALLFRKNPLVVIDENLYTNLACFLSDGFTVSYRGQPIDYPSLLYPLLLCPVYLLERLLGGDIFRWIQVFNCLLMASSVFPAYLFAKDFSGNEKKALLAAGLCMLMPDMLFSELLMTEPLLWPLALWMTVFAYRAYRDAESGKMSVKNGVLTGVFTFLMFVTKPGAICAGAVLIALLLIRALGKKQPVLPSMLPVLTVLALIAVWYGAYYLFLDRANTGALGLYDKQLSEFKPSDLLIMAEAALLTPLMCVFALCGVFALLPVIRSREYTADRRFFVFAYIAALLCVGIGSAVFVSPYKWEGGVGAIPVHMRYIAMFLPAFFTFTLSLPEREKKKKSSSLRKKGGEKHSREDTLTMVLLAVCAVLYIFPGVRMGFADGQGASIDAPTLGAFSQSAYLEGNLLGWILTAVTVMFTLFLIFVCLDKGCGTVMIRLSCVFLAGSMLFNSVCVAVNLDRVKDTTYVDDALEINRIIREKRGHVLGATPLEYSDIWSVWLDAHLDTALSEVTCEQLSVELQKHDGYYVPFVPVVQSPNKNSVLTPEADTFVLGITVAEHMELTGGNDIYTTQNGYFTVVTVRDGNRLADTAFIRLSRNTLNRKYTNNAIWIMDPARQSAQQLEVTLWAKGEGRLKVADTVFQLTDALTPYTVTVKGCRKVSVEALDGDVTLTTYTTRIAD